MLLAMALAVSSALGEEWTSPDGVVAVTVPNADDFELMDGAPDRFLVLWVSKDDSLYFGVIKTEIPPDVTLDRSWAEEEVAEEADQPISTSSTVIKNGREFWIATADSPGHGGEPLQITQAITQVGASAYRAYVGTVGAEPSARAVVDAFLNSLEIKQTSPNAESASRAEPVETKQTMPAGESAPMAESDQQADERAGDGIDWHTLSKRLGGVALLLLIGLMIWSFTSQGKTKG